MEAIRSDGRAGGPPAPHPAMSDRRRAGRLSDHRDVTIHGAGGTFATRRRVDAPLSLRSTIAAG
ncbi:MAG: hypothetical protein ABSG83_19055 [Roseiarcus sp.]|jgi:hypothetical protein